MGSNVRSTTGTRFAPKTRSTHTGQRNLKEGLIGPTFDQHNLGLSSTRSIYSSLDVNGAIFFGRWGS